MFILGIFISIKLSSMNANNTYLCITNKRIIKRSGVFSCKYVHYSLRNVGTVSVSESFFDTKGKNASASLIVDVKFFHNNVNGFCRLVVHSLKNAYNAYNLLVDQTEGNNEVLRVKTEK